MNESDGPVVQTVIETIHAEQIKVQPEADDTNSSHLLLTAVQYGNKMIANEFEWRSYLMWQNGFIMLFFSLIVIVSLCGNLLVCRTLMAQRRLRANSTNVLIGVLAISDLMMTIFNIPFTVMDIILKDWIFGSFFCILVSFVQANSVYVSSFTIGVIALNRQRLIYKFKPQTSHAINRRQTRVGLVSNRCCFWSRLCQKNQLEPDSEMSMELQTVERCANQAAPAKARFKLKASTRLALIIFAIWLLAALHSLPHSVYNRVKTIRVVSQVPSASTNSDEPKVRIVTVRRCVPEWPQELGDNFSLILTLFTTLTQYFIPLTCAGAIYTRIGFTIMAQGKVGEMSRGHAEQLTQKKRRRLLMLVSIGLSFALW